MQVAGGADAFESGDLRAFFHTFHLEHAGTGELAVEHDCAGAAMAFFAADFHAGQLKLLTENIGKSVVGVDKHLTLDAVDDKGPSEHRQLLEKLGALLFQEGKDFENRGTFCDSPRPSAPFVQAQKKM